MTKEVLAACVSLIYIRVTCYQLRLVVRHQRNLQYLMLATAGPVTRFERPDFRSVHRHQAHLLYSYHLLPYPECKSNKSKQFNPGSDEDGEKVRGLYGRGLFVNRYYGDKAISRLCCPLVPFLRSSLPVMPVNIFNFERLFQFVPMQLHKDPKCRCFFPVCLSVLSEWHVVIHLSTFFLYCYLLIPDKIIWLCILNPPADPPLQMTSNH